LKQKDADGQDQSYKPLTQLYASSTSPKYTPKSTQQPNGREKYPACKQA
jgi:hypothetical protein